MVAALGTAMQRQRNGGNQQAQQNSDDESV
jgi:hypothetical protein